MLGELFEGQRRSQRRQDAEDNSDRQRAARTEPEGEGTDSSENTASTTRTKISSTGDGSSLEVGDVSIIADEENNALLILSYTYRLRKSI